MKVVVSKPISSSPSRRDKFPPPLMRFLRSNVGSKSRGRSRSSPMFVRKKNAPIETQEPSSPKVTCIGQVRVRRFNKQHFSARPKPHPPTKCPSFCVPKSLFRAWRKPNFRSFQPVWRKWVSFFRCGCCGNARKRADSERKESRNSFQDLETEENGDEQENAEDVEIFISSTPPKNAFLLTRCRSAPYRSSSLAGRFWGSEEREDEEIGTNKKGFDFEETEREIERPFNLESQVDSRNSLEKSRNGEEGLEDVKQFEGSGSSITIVSGRNSEGSNHQEIRGNVAPLPLILTRCKSEPAKTGERLLINQENLQLLGAK